MKLEEEKGNIWEIITTKNVLNHLIKELENVTANKKTWIFKKIESKHEKTFPIFLKYIKVEIEHKKSFCIFFEIYKEKANALS